MVPRHLGLIVLLSSAASAAETPTGQFLLLERSVRAEGLGGAHAATLGARDGLFGNPASAAFLERARGALGGLARRVDDGSLLTTSGSAAAPVGRRLTLGAAASYLSFAIDGFDETGAEVAGATESDLSARAVVAWRSRNLAIGVAPKLLRQSLSASGRSVASSLWAVDVGLVGTTDTSWSLRVGTVLENAGPESGGFPLPTRLRVGVSLTPPMAEHVRLALDQVFSLAGPGTTDLGAGLEWTNDDVVGRLGLRLEKTASGPVEVTPTLGGGYASGDWTLDLSLGFFAVSWHDLGARAVLARSFGGGR